MYELMPLIFIDGNKISPHHSEYASSLSEENLVMEVLLSSVALTCAVVVLLLYTWKILNWLWFRPRSLEKCLRQLGFKGNSYRVFYGDFKEMRKMMKEAKFKPIKISDDIVPRVVPFILKAVENYGANCFVWFGPRPAVIVLDPESIREVLSKSYIFQKTSAANRSSRLQSRGIASHETDKWAKHRRLINPAFHVDKLKLMVPSFYLSCAEMLSIWEKIVPSEGKCEVDVWPYLQTMTSDAISRTAFGSSYEEGRKIFQLQKEQAELLTEERRSVYIPGWRFLPTKNNRRIKELVKEVESSVLNIIKKRMKTMESGEASTNDDLLGLLLESNFKEMKERGNKFGMSLEEVIEECKLFYFAGQETTAGLLVWTMILLSKHTHWQDRARDEVLQVLGRGTPDFQELNNLKIITMICHEVLRLYPPGVMLGRITVKDSSLGKTILPSGVQLLLPAILLHRDPKLWGDDAKEFNPERFSEGIPKGQFCYFPFGWGPRICIAQNFAMLEAKMALAMILQHYSFELSPSYSHAPHTVITLQPQHGAHLILRKL